jgi:hypothetical protein
MSVAHEKRANRVKLEHYSQYSGGLRDECASGPAPFRARAARAVCGDKGATEEGSGEEKAAGIDKEVAAVLVRRAERGDNRSSHSESETRRLSA